MLVKSGIACECYQCKKLITHGEYKYSYKKVTLCFDCGFCGNSERNLFDWIGYTRGFNWHLKLHNVNKGGTKKSWVHGEDLALAKEELKQATMLEF